MLEIDMATRHQVLESTERFVDGLIKQLTPDPEVTCTKAFEELGMLVKKSRVLTADDISHDAYFAEGIQAVIQRLDAVRNGFARTFEQENGVAKAAGIQPITKDMSVAEFAAFAEGTIRKAVKCAEAGHVGRALDALRMLKADIRKAASFEDTVASAITVTVENDPMRIIETEASGTLAPSGTSAPSSAASNYVVNPTGVSAPPPATGANPATGSAETQTSNTPAGASNFLAKGEANSEEDVTKSLASIAETVSKADPDALFADVGWCSDLSSPEFLNGDRRKRF
jgi:hypothetical protein